MSARARARLSALPLKGVLGAVRVTFCGCGARELRRGAPAHLPLHVRFSA